MARTVRVRVDEQSPLYQAGIDEGRKLANSETLTFLQDKYMHEGIERGSVEAQALLTLAGELAEHMREAAK